MPKDDFLIPTRRAFLRDVSVVGAVAVLPAGMIFWSNSADATSEDDIWWIAEVLDSGGDADGRVSATGLSAPEGVVDVKLDGFPDGWTLARGDLVALNIRTRLVVPYVETLVDGKDLVHSARNTDPARQREFDRIPLGGPAA